MRHKLPRVRAEGCNGWLQSINATDGFGGMETQGVKQLLCDMASQAAACNTESQLLRAGHGH